MVIKLTVIESLSNINLQFASYEIMINKSTKGDKKIFLVCLLHWNIVKEKPIFTILSMKDLDSCISSNVSDFVLETIKSFNCLRWITA